MFVAIVTRPGSPACSTICASRSSFSALSTSCAMPRRFLQPWTGTSTLPEMVPTSTGWPIAFRSHHLVHHALNFSSSEVLKMGPFFAADHRPVVGTRHHLEAVDLRNSTASVAAVPVMPDSFSYMRK